MTTQSNTSYPDFSSPHKEWPIRPARYFLKQKSVNVGNAWGETQLLSLTKSGVIDRDIDSGVGKYPASFEGYQVVERGDLVFCLFDVEETPRTVGLVKIRGMITGAYTAYSVDTEKADPRFLEYLFVSLDDDKRFKPFYSGLRNTIPKNALTGSRFSLPPVAEQTAIAAFLDREVGAIDNLLEKQQQLIETLAVRRKALLREVFSGKLGLTLTGYEISWKTMRLGLLAKNIEVKSSSVTAVSLEHIQSHTGMLIAGPELTEAVAGTEFREGDVLFGKLRPYLGKAYAAEFAGVAVGDIHVYRTNQLLPSFLKYWLISPTTLELINSSTYGTKMPRANWDQIKMLEVKFPPIESQKFIVDHLNAYLKRELLVSEKTVAASRLLSERRAALIAAAVTGKVDVWGKN